MTYQEIANIAKRLDKETQNRIDAEVEERLEILKKGDLDQEDMEKMEECLYMSLVLQEYLNGEYELLEEEKELLLAEMEEMYNEYGELLTKAKLEEKLSKKKRMALELMKIREQLMERKDRVKDVNSRMKDNKKNNKELKDLSSKKNMNDMVMGKKKSELPNPDKRKWGIDKDMGLSKGRGGGGSATSNNNLTNTSYPRGPRPEPRLDKPHRGRPPRDHEHDKHRHDEKITDRKRKEYQDVGYSIADDFANRTIDTCDRCGSPIGNLLGKEVENNFDIKQVNKQ